MHQSGHSDRYIPNYRVIESDYALHPPKPCMDAEPIYESHPFSWNPKYGISTDDDVRRAAYWALFSGAHGHSYGNHCIWQFYSDKVEPVNFPPMRWQEAMDLPGAFDMLHLRQLDGIQAHARKGTRPVYYLGIMPAEPWITSLPPRARAMPLFTCRPDFGGDC